MRRLQVTLPLLAGLILIGSVFMATIDSPIDVDPTKAYVYVFAGLVFWSFAAYRFYKIRKDYLKSTNKQK